MSAPTRESKPQAKPLSIDNIPSELKVLRQWVLWRYEPDGEKWTKPPFQPNGSNASSTAPTTWNTFESVLAAYQKAGFDGIGLVLSPEDPYAGIDLDYCIGADGQVTPEAAAIVKRLASYTEATPSGTGLRIFIRAKLPEGGRKRGNVEMYEAGRFLTVTGQHLSGTPTTIGERTAQISQIHGEVFSAKASPQTAPQGNGKLHADDAEILERALNAKNGAAFAALWRGDTSNYPSHSEGDLALCSHLAFWTRGDPVQIDRLFRQSTLYRPKWDEKHGDQTYGQATVAKALEGATHYRGQAQARRDGQGEGAADKTLPEVVIRGRMRYVTADALAAINAKNAPPYVFRRANALVRLGRDADGVATIDTLNEAAMRGIMDRTADYVEIHTKDKGKPTETQIKSNVPPPLHVVRDILALGEWQFPHLKGIVESPTLRADGSILATPGYDAASGLYYAPAKSLKLDAIPEAPSAQDIDRAKALILETICDFPFATEADGANALAAMFTPMLRPMIDGPVPLAIFDKPQQGTGASLLAEVVALIATARPAAMTSPKQTDEEWEKALSSLLLKGQGVVILDNLRGVLDSGVLSKLLTAAVHETRILGRLESITLPIRVTWLATGNNIQLRGDLPRRCYWVRMDAHEARPWLRPSDNFAHPHLTEWVSASRGRILAAMLTIARAYVLAGQPKDPHIPLIGSFEAFCCTLGGLLQFMGIRDFLGNLAAMYDEVDSDTKAWEGFLTAWRESLNDKAMTAHDFVTFLASDDATPLRTALPDSLADRTEKNYTRRLGNALRQWRGVRFENGLTIEQAGDKQRAALWRVRPGGRLTAFSFKSELGELGSKPFAGKENVQDSQNVLAMDLDSRDSPSDTKSVSLAPQDSPGGAPAEVCAVPGCGEPVYVFGPDGVPYCERHEPLEKPCPYCGGSKWWWRPDGTGPVCGRCHPNPAVGR